MNTIMQKLSGKTALVTGAARGIGLAIARRFAGEGANVAIVDLDEAGAGTAADAIAGEFGVKTLAVRADTGRAGDNAQMIARAIGHFGQLDILVCNAGIVRPAKPLEDITPEQWQQVIDVNLLGYVHATSAFIPHAKARKSGKVIYMASVAGQVGGVAAEVTYSVTKAGVLCLTKATAKQLGPYNIHVNAIAPGTIETAMTDVLNYSPEVKKGIALGRYGEVDDISAAALYLASDDSNYVTGATLDVNGGLFMR
ncbi:SDR family NAD(P)-dependent oxidoreductase [Herbaspirillum robiniae]|uniref:SDR family oxidoreductase n=1 Tax=Herbaspirillum robiniae TaxID=2014887 RepID=A0ABX2LR40_9BURK|nr:SDR family NAD(P)-dependent oxidoreductase [Herbaspirillum robiniae]NUU01022.1 SDR family oxidoreductase [Herbaspirillum robiniae]